MATGKAIRADDVSGLNLATRTATEDAVTKHWQRVHLSDPGTPTQELGIDASGNAKVIAAANSGVDIGDATINNASGASAVNIQDGGNSITVDGTVAVSGTVAVTDNSGSLTVDNGGTFAVQAAQSGTWNVTNVSGTVSLPTGAATAANQLPATSGGYTTKHVVAAASANATSVKASAGQVYGWSIFNNAAYPVFVKFHNTAGTPTAGSGVVQTIGVQAGTQVNISNTHGIAFGTGIGITIVKDLADAGTTAVAASDCVVDLFYV